MEEKSTATLEKIQEAALAEFLEKGFQGASLRQIVKNAGVTTGAFYGYFSRDVYKRQVGYGSASQFSAAFHRQYGMTPAMYRKMSGPA